MHDNKTLDKMRAARARKNYGIVLRTINILRHRYEALAEVYAALDMPEQEYLDSLNYLAGDEYIHLRVQSTKADADLADWDYQQLEAKVTPKGIRLLGGVIDDPMIEV